MEPKPYDPFSIDSPVMETSRDSYPPALIQRLAQQIYLLDHAVEVLDEDLPQDAYLVSRFSAIGNHRRNRSPGHPD